MQAKGINPDLPPGYCYSSFSILLAIQEPSGDIGSDPGQYQHPGIGFGRYEIRSGLPSVCTFT